MNKKKIKSLSLVLFIFASAYVFKINHDFYKIITFKNRPQEIWMHGSPRRVLLNENWAYEKNSSSIPIINLNETTPLPIPSTYEGIEIDVLWDSKIDKLIVSHDTADDNLIETYRNKKITLETFLNLINKLEKKTPKVWFDFKNLDVETAQRAIEQWKTAIRLLNQSNYIIENRNKNIAILYQEAGFNVTWWIPNYFNIKDSFLPMKETTYISLLKLPYRLMFNFSKAVKEIAQRQTIVQNKIYNISMYYKDYLYIRDSYRHLNISVWTNHDEGEAPLLTLKKYDEIRTILQ